MLVATVRVEEPEPLTDAWLKLAEAPPGKPLALRFTMPLNPPSEATVTV